LKTLGDDKNNWQCPICFIIYFPTTPQCERCGGFKPRTASASFTGGLAVDSRTDQKRSNRELVGSPRSTTDVFTKEGILKKKNDRVRHLWEDRFFLFL